MVTLIDANAHEVIRNIELGQKGQIKPMGLALSPDAKTLYVSTGRGKRVFMIGTSGGNVIESIDVGKRPWGVGVSPDGKTLFAADGPSNEVVVVDLTKLAITKRIKAGDSPWGILVLP